MDSTPRPESKTSSKSGRAQQHLVQAAWTGDAETIELLLKMGVDPNAPAYTRGIPPRHVTPLQALALAPKPMPGLVKYLIRHGATTQKMDDEGNTALHLAVRHRPELVPALLEHGADPNATNKAGQTPMLLAVEQGALTTLQVLMAGGGDPTVQPPGGISALQRARQMAISQDGNRTLDYLERSIHRIHNGMPPAPVPGSLDEALSVSQSVPLGDRLRARREMGAAARALDLGMEVGGVEIMRPLQELQQETQRGPKM